MKNNYLEKYRQDNLRKAQMKKLYILKEVVAVCDRHKIPYWLDGGTLLGAARHGGFIPWDDDVDISMRKEDLERFLKIAPSELPEDLMVQTLETDEGLHNRAYKVRDLNSFFVDGDDDNRAPYQKGMFVDIFPMDRMPLDQDRRIQIYKEKVYSKLDAKALSDKYSDGNDSLYGVIATSNDNREFIRYKEDYLKSRKLKFEGLDVNVPYDYEKCCEQQYGENWREYVVGYSLHQTYDICCDVPYYRYFDFYPEKKTF